MSENDSSRSFELRKYVGEIACFSRESMIVRYLGTQLNFDLDYTLPNEYAVPPPVKFIAIYNKRVKMARVVKKIEVVDKIKAVCVYNII